MENTSNVVDTVLLLIVTIMLVILLYDKHRTRRGIIAMKEMLTPLSPEDQALYDEYLELTKDWSSEKKQELLDKLEALDEDVR